MIDMTYRVVSRLKHAGGLCVLPVLLCVASPVVTLAADTDIAAPFHSRLEARMFRQWQSDQTFGNDLLAAVLIAEGVDTSAAVDSIRMDLEKIFRRIDTKIKSKDSAKRRGKKIYKILHKHCLRRYDVAAYMKSVAQSGVYNCVTSTALFVIAAKRFDVPVSISLTPSHVFCNVRTGKSDIRVEMTDPLWGYDSDTSVERTVDYLVKYKLVTKQEVEEKGAIAVYDHVFENTREISERELVGVVYNNLGLEQIEHKDMVAGFDTFEKALIIAPNNQDYRETFQSLFSQISRQLSQKNAFDALVPIIRRVLKVEHDSRFLVLSVIPAVGRCVDYLALERGDEVAAENILDHVEKILHNDVEALQAFNNEVDRYRYNQIVGLVNSGNHRSAREMILNAPRSDIEDKKVTDLYISSTCRYASDLAEAGNTDEAATLVASLYADADEYPTIAETAARIERITIRNLTNAGHFDVAYERMLPVLRDFKNNHRWESLFIYVARNLVEQLLKSNAEDALAVAEPLLDAFPTNTNVMSDYVRVKAKMLESSKMIDNEPEEAKTELLELHLLDPENRHVRILMADVCNVLGVKMATSKSPGRFREAEALFEEALTFDPGNQSSLKNLRIVRKRLK